ncbi:MAG: TatD family hydrolase [bacterium]
MLIDTHAHLDDEQFASDLEAVLANAAENDVKTIITIGCDMQSSEKAVKLAEKYPYIYAVVGVHPDDAASVTEADYIRLRELARHEKAVAIGEIGLDYYWDKAPRDKQAEVFRRQIRLANDLGLPIAVHDREAHQDTLRILAEEKPQRCILHCFSGSQEMALECVKKGYYLSFGGPLTFKNARKAVEAAKAVPLERILLETDCPYLSPHPYRGKRNEPARTAVTAAKLAEVKGVSLEEVKEVTTRTAVQVFKLKV